MKTCSKCSMDCPDGAPTCPNCGTRFPDKAGKAAAARPTGAGPTTFGWICFGLALICVFLSYATGASHPYDTDAAYRSGFLFQVAAGGLFSMWVVFFSVGYIANCISFLPRRED